ncbi:MAG: RecX family transcriptional regulator [Duncaniella sp.]|nr:RecX family transcriptional regulator [Duncaniella sp.]
MPLGKPRKPLDYSQALSRCASLCEQCEQCTPDLLAKMARWGVSHSDASKVISKLESLRFVDDRRFARAFAHDKVCFSGWGRYKVIRGLMAKRLPREIIDIAMEGVEEEEYLDVLRRVTASRLRRFEDEMPDYEERMKILRHLLQRGFESALAVKTLREELARHREEIAAREDEESEE